MSDLACNGGHFVAVQEGPTPSNTRAHNHACNTIRMRIYTLLMDVKAARNDLNLSQAQLAEKLGVTQATVSRLETGKLPVDERTKLALEALRFRAAA